MAFGSELLVRLRLQSGYLAMGLALTWHGLFFNSYTRRKSSARGELDQNPICRSIARKGLSAVGFHDLSSPKFANDDISRRSLFTQRAQHR